MCFNIFYIFQQSYFDVKFIIWILSYVVKLFLNIFKSPRHSDIGFEAYFRNGIRLLTKNEYLTDVIQTYKYI